MSQIISLPVPSQRSKKMCLSTFLLSLLVTFSHAQSYQGDLYAQQTAVTPTPRPGFLFVPPNTPRSQGIYLRETPRDELPPGEYEIVAMFEQPRQAQPARQTPVPSPTPIPSHFVASTVRSLIHNRKVAQPSGVVVSTYAEPRTPQEMANSYIAANLGASSPFNFQNLLTESKSLKAKLKSLAQSDGEQPHGLSEQRVVQPQHVVSQPQPVIPVGVREARQIQAQESQRYTRKPPPAYHPYHVPGRDDVTPIEPQSNAGSVAYHQESQPEIHRPVRQPQPVAPVRHKTFDNFKPKVLAHEDTKKYVNSYSPQSHEYQVKLEEHTFRSKPAAAPVAYAVTPAPHLLHQVRPQQDYQPPTPSYTGQQQDTAYIHSLTAAGHGSPAPQQHGYEIVSTVAPYYQQEVVYASPRPQLYATTPKPALSFTPQPQYAEAQPQYVIKKVQPRPQHNEVQRPQRETNYGYENPRLQPQPVVVQPSSVVSKPRLEPQSQQYLVRQPEYEVPTHYQPSPQHVVDKRHNRRAYQSKPKPQNVIKAEDGRVFITPLPKNKSSPNRIPVTRQKERKRTNSKESLQK